MVWNEILSVILIICNLSFQQLIATWMQTLNKNERNYRCLKITDEEAMILTV